MSGRGQLVRPRSPKKEGGRSQKKRGRPRREINYEMVERLRSMLVSEEEIADVVGLTRRGFQKRKAVDPELCRALDRGWSLMKLGLRKAQMKSAERGSTAMLIWLGKNYLGQKNKVEEEVTHRTAAGGLEANVSKLSKAQFDAEYGDVINEVVQKYFPSDGELVGAIKKGDNEELIERSQQSSPDNLT